MLQRLASELRASPDCGWGNIPRPRGRSGDARRCRRAISLLFLATLLPAGPAQADDTTGDGWKVLTNGNRHSSCRPGIGWVGGVGQIVQTTYCALLVVPHPPGVGWISASNRPTRGSGQWYKTHIDDGTSEAILTEFLGQVCDVQGADGAIAQAKGKTVFFRCAEDDPE